MIPTLPTDEIPGTAEAEAERETFCIDSESAANWLLKRLANIEAEKGRVKAQAEAILRQLDSDAESLRHLYEAELQAFVRQRLAESGNRRKSVHFLQGTAGFRAGTARVVISDRQAAMDYAREHDPDGLIVTTATLATCEYRALAETALTETGEVLPGTEIVPEHESFCLRFHNSNGNE